MSYIGRQYGHSGRPAGPHATAGSESASQSSDSNSDIGLMHMPQVYQVHTKTGGGSPSRKKALPASEDRLVMLAKHPHVTDQQVDAALEQERIRKAVKRQAKKQPKVSFEEPQQPQPVHVIHQAPNPYPQGKNHQDLHQVQYGGYQEPWEEQPPPKKSFLASIFGSDASSLEGENSSYAQHSYASESTRKASNVDEAARAKRLKQEAALPRSSSFLGRFCRCMFKTKLGLFLSALVVALILAGILIMGAALGGFNAKDDSPNSFNQNDGMETWIPRPQDDDMNDSSEIPTPQPSFVMNKPSSNRPPTEPLPATSSPATPMPTMKPSLRPTTSRPTSRPTASQSFNPTRKDSSIPTNKPTPYPTERPSKQPTPLPSSVPTMVLKNLQPLGFPLEGFGELQQFGYAIDTSRDGTILAVGIPFASVSTSPMETTQTQLVGMVQVYVWEGEKWTARGPALTGRNDQDKFGSALALSDDGSILVASEPTFDGSAGDRSGNIRSFKWDGKSRYNSMAQELEGVAATDHFGISLSLSQNGRILAAGAPYHDNTSDATRNVSGEARVFELVDLNNGEIWIPLGSSLAGESHFDWFGWEVDLNAAGSVLCVGAPRNLKYGGYVNCYSYEDDWIIMGSSITNTISPTRYDDNFGHSLSIYGNDRVAIGSPGKNSQGLDSGLVAVYEFKGNNWNRLGNTITGNDLSHQLGFALALRGNTLLVGIPGKDSRGEVNLYYFDETANEWQVNPDPLVGSVGSNFGFSISLAQNTVAVGSAVTDGANTGKVHVFQHAS
jgi:hypothetical protein